MHTSQKLGAQMPHPPTGDIQEWDVTAHLVHSHRITKHLKKIQARTAGTLKTASLTTFYAAAQNLYTGR